MKFYIFLTSTIFTSFFQAQKIFSGHCNSKNAVLPVNSFSSIKELSEEKTSNLSKLCPELAEKCRDLESETSPEQVFNKFISFTESFESYFKNIKAPNKYKASDENKILAESLKDLTFFFLSQWERKREILNSLESIIVITYKCFWIKNLINEFEELLDKDFKDSFKLYSIVNFEISLENSVDIFLKEELSKENFEAIKGFLNSYIDFLEKKDFENFEAKKAIKIVVLKIFSKLIKSENLNLARSFYFSISNQATKLGQLFKGIPNYTKIKNIECLKYFFSQALTRNKFFSEVCEQEYLEIFRI